MFKEPSAGGIIPLLEPSAGGIIPLLEPSAGGIIPFFRRSILSFLHKSSSQQRASWCVERTLPIVGCMHQNLEVSL